MTPRITVMTLGVDDLERAVGVYREGVGLPTQGIVGTYEHGPVASFISGKPEARPLGSHGHNFRTLVYSQIFAGSVPVSPSRQHG